MNLGNYENVRVGLVMSFHESETPPSNAYVKVKGIVDAWATEIRLGKAEVQKIVDKALPAPSGRMNEIMDALKPYAHRLTTTETSQTVIVRCRGRLEREAWAEVDTLVRGFGGKWLGTREGLQGKDVHWEIPK